MARGEGITQEERLLDYQTLGVRTLAFYDMDALTLPPKETVIEAELLDPQSLFDEVIASINQEA